MDINPSRPDAQQSGERPLNLSDFAQRNQITEDRVWELIEEGELAARFVNDEILILREQDASDEPQIDLPATPDIAIHDASDILPMEPGLEGAAVREPAVRNQGHGQAAPTVRAATHEPIVRAATHEPTARTATHEPAARTAMHEPTARTATHEPTARTAMHEPTARTAMHDTTAGAPAYEKSPPIQMESDDDTRNGETEHDAHELPADDYRDLLVFAQDAMNRTMDLSRQLLATKDELIRMKDERIQQLVFEQQRHEHEIRRLRKKIEDLETLCRLTPNP